MKANAKDIVIQSYSLVHSDEMLTQWRTENRGVAMSDEKIRSKLLKERITDLIGDLETKDSFLFMAEAQWVMQLVLYHLH